MEEKNEAENQASSLSSILHIVSSTMLEVITLLVLQHRNMVSSSEEDFFLLFSERQVIS